MIYRVDPATLEAEAVVEVDAEIEMMSVDSESIWYTTYGTPRCPAWMSSR